MAAQNLKTENMCEVDEGVVPVMKKIKFNKKTPLAAIIKVVVNENKIIVEDELEDITTDELREELPELQPRYVLYSFKHTTRDGRKTDQLCFIYYHPSGCNPAQLMRYAGCYTMLYKLSGAVKTLELTECENLTDEWLVRQLKLP